MLVFGVRGRYAVLFSKGDVRLLEEEVPEPKGNEVLVRVGACGVCTGDLYAYLGYRVWFSTPARFADLLLALRGWGLSLGCLLVCGLLSSSLLLHCWWVWFAPTLLCSSSGRPWAGSSTHYPHPSP